MNTRLVIGLLSGLISSHMISSSLAADKLNDAHICKAVVAAANGRIPRIIETEGTTGEISLHYTRPTDGKFWAYRCLVQGRRVYVADDGQEFNFNGNVHREFEIDANRQQVKVVETFKGEEASPSETWVKFSDLGIR